MRGGKNRFQLWVVWLLLFARSNSTRTDEIRFAWAFWKLYLEPADDTRETSLLRVPKQQSPFITLSWKSPYFSLQMIQNSSLVLTSPRLSHYILPLHEAGARVRGDYWNCVEKLHSAHKYLPFLHQPERLVFAFTNEWWSNFTAQSCKISQVL